MILMIPSSWVGYGDDENDNDGGCCGGGCGDGEHGNHSDGKIPTFASNFRSVPLSPGATVAVLKSVRAWNWAILLGGPSVFNSCVLSTAGLPVPVRYPQRGATRTDAGLACIWRVVCRLSGQNPGARCVIYTKAGCGELKRSLICSYAGDVPCPVVLGRFDK